MTNINDFSFDTLLCGTKSDEYYLNNPNEKLLCDIMELGNVARDIIDNKNLTTNKKISLPDISKVDIIINKEEVLTLPEKFREKYLYKYNIENDEEFLYILCGQNNVSGVFNFNVHRLYKINLKDNTNVIYEIQISLEQNEFDLLLSEGKNIDYNFIILDNIINISFSNKNFLGFDSRIFDESTSIDGNEIVRGVSTSFNSLFLFDKLNNIDIPVNNLVSPQECYIVNKTFDDKILLFIDSIKSDSSGITEAMTLIAMDNGTFIKNYTEIGFINLASITDITSNKTINNFIYLLLRNKNKLIMIDNRINSDNKYDMNEISIVNFGFINDIYLHNINNDYYYVIHKGDTIFINIIGEINNISELSLNIDLNSETVNKIESTSNINNIYLHNNLLFVESSGTILLYMIDFINNKTIQLSGNLYTGTDIKSFKVNRDGTYLIINDGDKFISIKF